MATLYVSVFIIRSTESDFSLVLTGKGNSQSGAMINSWKLKHHQIWSLCNEAYPDHPPAFRRAMEVLENSVADPCGLSQHGMEFIGRMPNIVTQHTFVTME